jgi:hypothetical protein
MGEDSAAFEAIRYMENATNTLAKDLKYERLGKCNETLVI